MIPQVIDDFTPPTYNYLLGKDVFVAPIYSAGVDATPLSLALPDSRSWVYWWDHDKVFNQTATLPGVPLDEYSVFFAKGNASWSCMNFELQLRCGYLQ